MTGLEEGFGESQNGKPRVGRMQRKLDATYMTYPQGKPFIDSEYQQDSTTTVKAFPESNREAIMSALRNLQEKIRRLELGISTAQTEVDETNRVSGRNVTVCDKSTGTSLSHSDSRRVASTVQNSVASVSGNNDALPKRTYDQGMDEVLVTPECLNEGRGSVAADIQSVNERLLKAQSRCEHLETNLEHMRALVKQAQSERGDSHRAAQIQQQGHQTYGGQGSSLLENKFKDLEREQLKLIAAQALSENKVRELESRLHEEIYSSSTENISPDTSVRRDNKQKRKEATLEKSHVSGSAAHVSWDETPVTAQIHASVRNGHGFSGNKGVRGWRLGQSVGRSKPLIDSSAVKSFPSRGGRSVASHSVRGRSRSTSRSDSISGRTRDYASKVSIEKGGQVDASRTKDSFGKIKPNNNHGGRDRSEAIQKPVERYTIALAELPFIAGKSVGPSHSVNANLQQVIALLKLGHSPLICRPHLNQSHNITVSCTGQSQTSRRCSCCSAAAAAGDKGSLKEGRSSEKADTERETRRVCWEDGDQVIDDSSSADDLQMMSHDVKQLLQRLLDDYASLSFDRDELQKKVALSASTRRAAGAVDLQENLAKITEQLEVKSEEISIVQRIKRALMLNMSEKEMKSLETSARTARHTGTINNSNNNESFNQVSRDGERKYQQHVDSNILAERLADNGSIERSRIYYDTGKVSGSSASRVQSRLELYKELRRIQSVLKNEGTWRDC